MISHWSGISIACLNALFVWTGLRLTIGDGIDGQARLQTVLVLLAFTAWYAAQRKETGSQRLYPVPICLLFVWVVYASVNSIVQFVRTPQLSATLFISVYLIQPFLIAATVALTAPSSAIRLIRTVQVSLVLFFILIVAGSGFDGGRIYLDRFDPNELSLYLYALISVVGLNYFLGLQGPLITAAILLPVFVFSVQLGSRMGFAGCLILAAGIVLVTRRTSFSIGRLLLATPLVLAILSYVLSETALGERLLGTASQTTEWRYDPAEGTVFQYYGDRGVYYIVGWQAWMDSPVVGIGLLNFSPNYYHTVMHPEVMIQLAELGLLGFGLYIGFLFAILMGLVRVLKIFSASSHALRYLLYVFSVLVYSSTVLFLYHSFAVALLYGLLVLLSRSDVLQHINQHRQQRALADSPPRYSGQQP